MKQIHRKKGFMLIELLAVIVVLAILAVIAVPFIMNVIKNSEKGAFKDSVYGIMKSAQLYILTNTTEYPFTINYPEDMDILQISGEKPTEGFIQILREGEIRLQLGNNKWCAKKEIEEVEITIKEGKCESSEIQKPILSGYGELEQKIKVGEAYTLPTVTAVASDGSILPVTHVIKKDGVIVEEINTDIVNVTYTLTFTAQDPKTNQTTSKTITIQIVDLESLEHNLLFDTMGGEEIASKKVIYKETYGELPIPQREDYEFLGWYSKAEGGEPVKDTNILEKEEDVTIYARWKQYIYRYTYTGEEATWIVPETGEYQLEAWGAQGGGSVRGSIGGYGAYVTGKIHLTQGETLYIQVGGQGTGDGTVSYNGGGAGNAYTGSIGYAGGGGGATHIATKSGLLSTLENALDSIYLIAGAGGGASEGPHNGGNAGGIKGNDGIGAYLGRGGTQTGGVAGDYTPAGTFGQGTNADPLYATGSGLYGGSGASWSGTQSYASSGGGGSSYIGNTKLTDRVMYCHSCVSSEEENTKTISTTNADSVPTSNYAKIGDGYVKITILDQ